MEHPISGRRNTDSGPRASVRDSIFEKPRAKATSSKIPSSKLQRSTKLQAAKKHQAPSSKIRLRAGCPGIRLWGLVFGIWNFSGAWGLELGVSLSGSPRAEMFPDRVRAGA